MDTSAPRLLHINEVLKVTGWRHRQTLWRAVKDGKFPPPVHLSEKTRAWIASEVHAWVERRILERNQRLEKRESAAA